jgi:hypothetical protein
MPRKSKTCAATTRWQLACWISRALSARGFTDPVALDRLAGMYWVCGMAGGCCSTAELDARIRGTSKSIEIADGPFERLEDAEYAFDRMWESPE